MIEYIVLGFAQGIAEWLPISSEGMIVLIKTNIFGAESLTDSIHTALFLHLGTFLAALVYFRSDIRMLVQSAVKVKLTDPLVRFLTVATLLSGGLGYILLQVVESYESVLFDSARYVTIGIGLLLLVTGYLQHVSNKGGLRKDTSLNNTDSIILGLAQAFAAFPGLSRSGLTISALLLRGVNEHSALKISFLMSLPIVFFGNILLNTSGVFVTTEGLVGLGTSFVVGLMTISGLMKYAQTVNFGTFVIVFGIITIIAALI